MLQQSNSVRGATNLAHLIPLTEPYIRASYTVPVYSSLKISKQVCVRLDVQELVPETFE